MGRKPKIEVEAVEEMEPAEVEELAVSEITESRAGRRPRLSTDERESILRDIRAGVPKKDLADKFSVSYSTIVNIEKSGEPVRTPRVSVQAESSPSELHNAIFMLGFRYLNGEQIPESELTEMRERVQAEIKAKIQNIALSL